MHLGMELILNTTLSICVTYASSPGCLWRSCKKLRRSPFTNTSLTHDRHFLTSDSEFLRASSCILMSSDTIGSMNDQNDCVYVWEKECTCCVYVGMYVDTDQVAWILSDVTDSPLASNELCSIWSSLVPQYTSVQTYTCKSSHDC